MKLKFYNARVHHVLYSAVVLSLLLFLSVFQSHAQTFLITPTGDGGFENATSSFGANNWLTALPGATRQWQVNTFGGSVGGGTKSAYLGTAAVYNGANNAQVGHFYRDVTIPAGATNVQLSFYQKLPTIDASWDFLRVFTTTTSNTPVSGTSPTTGYTLLYENTATQYTAFTLMGPFNLTSLAGTTVRLVFTNVADGVAPHATFAVDNISLSYTPAAACSGTPTGGTTNPSANPVCSGANFNLSLTGASTGTGLQFQWESSPNGTVWTPISGATLSTLTTSQTAATFYHCVLTCGLNPPGNSSSLLVTMNSFTNCYCVPSYSTGCANDRITSFQINTLNNNSGATCSTSPAGYSVYGTSPSNLTTTLDQGGSYTATIAAIAGNGNGTGVAIWIDYNDNATFDASERNDNGATKFTSNTTGTLNVNVPVNAPLGQHRMRVVSARNVLSNALGACTPGNAQGETEDYIVTIAVATACSGNPNAGATQSTANPACSGGNFTLTLFGATNLAGLTYQWQSSPDNTTWTNISNATNSNYVGNQTVATYYQCIVTCTNGGASSTSTSLLVGVTPMQNCYCAGTYDFDCGIDYISNVTFGSINRTSTCDGALPTNRTIYSPANAVFFRGLSYQLSVTTDGDDEAMRAWIDYDHSFTFVAGESVLSSGIQAPPFTTSATITIPMTAQLGQTILRVRNRYNALVGTGAACTNFTSSDYGETEDYIITIADQVTCSGTPAPGNTVSTLNPACPSANFTLTTSTAIFDLNITYQWQSSPDGSSWTNVPSGGTNSSYTTSQTVATYYRCVVTCTSSGLSGNSSALQITMGDACACGAYCATSQTDGSCLSPDEFISNVTFNTINNTSDCAQSLPSGYTNYTSLSTTIQQGQSYPFTFTNGGDFSGDQGHVFFDWNSDGDWSDAGEDITLTGTGGLNNAITWSANITVPMTAVPGISRMRARVYFTTFNGPCTVSDYGEAEDYCINIIPAPACSGLPAASTTVASANPACFNTGFTLSLGTSYTTSGLTFQWESAPDVSGNPGSFANISNATNATYAASQTAIIWYRCTVTCTNGGQSITSTNLRVTTQLCYCTPTYTNGCALDKISNFVLNTLSNNSGTTCSTSPAGYSVYGTTPANQTTILSPGTSYTSTITVVTGNANGTGVAIWIDYNDNGNFDIAENNNNGATKFASNTTGTLVVNVPANASPGQHRMRVVSARNTNSIDVGACTPGNAAGETEDYTITIADPSASSNTPVCEGDTLKLFASPAGASSYTWTGPNSFSSTLQNPTIAHATPAASGVYQCTIIVGSNTYTPTTSVVVNAAPNVLATSNAPFCSATSNLNLNSNAPTATSFAWNGPGGYLSTQANPTISTPSNTASGNYEVVVTDGNGCKDSSTLNVVIYTLPTINILVTGLTNLCTGQTTAELEATGASTYLWSTTETLNQITVSTAGTYSVTGTDIHNCVNNKSQVITESAPPAAPVIAPAGPVLLCFDANGVIPETLTCTSHTTGLDWSSTQTTTSISVDYEDLFFVTYTDGNGCISQSNTVATVFDAVAPTLVCPGDITSCSTTPALGTPTTSDNCSVASVTNDAPAVFPLGTTEVTWTATDYNNNVSTCVQMVSIQSPSSSPSGITSNANYNQVCLGSSVTLAVTGGSLGTGASWNWYEGNCGTGILLGQGTSITTTPSSAGPHNYYVRAEGACGNSGCASLTLNVITSPPSGTVSYTTTLLNGCVGAPGSTISVNAVSGASYYRWNSGQAGVRFNGNPGPYETTVPNVSVTFVSLPASGSSGWSICVFGANACGNTNTACSWVRAIVGMPAFINGSSVGCPGTSGNVYTSASEPGAASYQWSSTGGMVISNNGSQSIQVQFPGGFVSGTLSVHAQTACGYNGANRTIAITGTPSIPGAITGTSYPCPNGSASYSIAAVPGAANYTWTTSVPGAIVSGTTTSCSIQFPAVIPAGSTVSVAANSSCPTTGPVRSKGIASGVPNVPLVINGPSSGQCAQTGVSYTINPVALATSYAWTTTCGSIVGPNNITAISVNWPNSFTVCTLSVTSSNACGTSVPRILGVFAAPSMPPAIAGNAAPCAGGFASYSTTGSSGATGYVWTVPAGATILGPSNGASINVLWGSTSGNVTVRASNDCGNSQLRSLPCIISCRMNQVNTSGSFNAEVFPNPAREHATIKFTADDGSHYQVKLVNMLGENVMTLEGVAVEGINMIEINTASIAKGVYMIVIESNNLRYQEKLVVE